ncbi:MAG TPA: hypothetical protein VGX94_05320 [Terriglobia bacterium]|nr:hypothetical protein [Terriglobia bacterium]
MVIRFSRWIKYLAAVIVGNILYFESTPLLPPAARHHRLVDWGTFVDLWFCLFVYGVIELVLFLARKPRNQQ